MEKGENAGYRNIFKRFSPQGLKKLSWYDDVLRFSHQNLEHIFIIHFFLLTLYQMTKFDKILDWSTLKAFADDKINETEKLKFILEKVENIVGKGENAGYQHFLLFP